MVLGTITVLFFQCMDALFNPVRRKEGKIKWAFVAHTVAMFLLVTVNWCTNFYIYSTSSIDNREFPGGLTTPLYSKPMNYIPEIAFFLNSWLADGLLVCSVSNLTTQMPHPGRSSSSIGAMGLTA